MTDGMRRCSCCKNWWPLECFAVARRRVDGTPILRASCEACRHNCGPARARLAVERTRAWKARLRADLAALRSAS